MPSHSGPTLSGLPVNFHITRACNFSCGHCFATFQDVNKGTLAPDEDLHLQIVASLASLGAAKITFSGGEPLLVRWLPKLLQRARSLRLTTCVVTNGSLLSESWLAMVAADLDWLTLSVDSVAPKTNARIGRATKRGPLAEDEHGGVLKTMATTACSLGIGLKVNTVVTKHNQGESLANFIAQVKPVRWKIMQAMPVDGQNQRPTNEWNVDDNDFEQYVNRHRDKVPEGVAIVPEPINLIRGSYIMVDPWGRIFDSILGKHRYRAQIQQASSNTLECAVDRNKLMARSGIWDWNRGKFAQTSEDLDYNDPSVVHRADLTQ